MTTMLEKMKAQMAQAMTLSGVSSITISAEPLPRDKANPTRVEFPPMFDLDAIARAGLQAIREPSDEMLAPACRTHRPGEPMSETRPEECPAISRRRARFTAMIDAILNEPNNTP